MLKVMIVDDHEPSLSITAMLMKRYGYGFVTAVNGADALDKIRQDAPDLIITDILMPVMDGFSLCRELKKDERLKSIPLIFVSATFVDPRDEKFGLSLGAEAFILKTQDADAFMGELQEIIQQCTDAGFITAVPADLDDVYRAEYTDTLNRKLRKKILEHEKTNRRLMQSEEQYRRIVETANEGIWTMDVSYCISFVNPMMSKMLGYTQEEIVGRKVDSFMFPEDRPGHSYRMQQGVEGADQRFERRFRRKDGSELWTIVSATALKDEQGDFAGSFAMFTDITDRKLAEDELRATHEMFLTVLDGIDATIYVADMETHEILFMNNYMKNLFGGDFTGQACWKAFRKQSQPCSDCKNEHLVDENNKPTRVQVREDTHPVTGRRNIYHERAIKWVDGRMVRLQIATDITQLKELEDKQQEYERRIQQAQKMEAMGTLAGGIAHDFNNILSPLMGYTEMLREDVSLDSSLQDYVDEIMHASLRARDLVKQILTFSRQSRQEMTPLKLQPIVKEALKLLRASIPSTIDIRQNIDSACGIVQADPTQLHQIVMNLATNAYHAMENTSGQLKVTLKQVRLEPGQPFFPNLAPGDYALLVVSDTGTGIDKRDLEKIFDPYFTTKGKDKGTGLGLAVVQGIVRSYHGDIRIYSEPGKGTEAHVYLPILEQKGIPRGLDPAKPVKGGSERILLVDDEEAIVRMEQQTLERLGYRVTTHTASMEALDTFKSNPDGYDLIITDMTMPNMNGVQLSDAIRKIRPGIPVILCTGFSEHINDETCTALGIQSLVRKPVIKREFAEAIRDALD